MLGVSLLESGRQEVVDLASEYAAGLDIRKLDNPFSLRWFYSFLKRWPDLRVVKPRVLEIARVKGSNKLYACAAYMKSATPENLISTFKKTGIFPLNRDIIDSNIFAPAEVFHNENINVTMNDVVVNESQSVEVEERGLVTKEEVGGMNDSRSEYGCNFCLRM